MISNLTRYGARIAVLMVLAIGALIAVSAITDNPAQHPGQAGAEQRAEAEEALELLR